MAPSLTRPIATALVATVLALYAWTAWSATLRKGPAFDESAHLVAGTAYWAHNDYRLQPENGNLPQRWVGLAMSAIQPHLAPAETSAEWSRSNVWRIGQKFLFESGNSPEWLLAAGRGAMTLWGVACGLLVFFWSRSLWGDAGGLLSLTLFAGSPTLLAHGPLITSDTAAAFCLLAATGAFWRQLKNPGLGPLAISLVLTGLASIAKFSVLLLPAIYGLLLAWHFLRHPSSPAKTAARIAGLVSAHAVAALLFVWAAFGFRYSAAAAGMPTLVDFYIPWEHLLPQEGPRRWFLILLKDYRLLPEAYTHGLAYVLKASEARGAFAAGQFSQTGWWWFFPYAFLIKSTLAELAALIVCGTLALLLAKRGGKQSSPGRLDRLAPLLVFASVYGGAAIFSNLNIGHRHILPLYLPLFIITGALLRPSVGLRLRMIACTLLVAQTVEAVVARPFFLAHFNLLAGPADQRWKHLVDSSLDWGQELPALGDWLREKSHPSEPLHLTYFGVGDPRHEGITATSFAPYFASWTTPVLKPLSPGLFCISATSLQDPYSPYAGPWTQQKENTFAQLRRRIASEPEAWGGPVLNDGTVLEQLRWHFERARFARLAQYLRVRPPDAVIGRSILVYRLDAREIALAGDLPTGQIAELIEKAIKAKP